MEVTECFLETGKEGKVWVIHEDRGGRKKTVPCLDHVFQDPPKNLLIYKF
jgi:hypothetical protein